MMDKISGFTGVNRRGNIFKLITALKQICNHPYQFLKSGETSKELSGKAEKCVSLVQSILDNNEKNVTGSLGNNVLYKILEYLIYKRLDSKIVSVLETY